MGIHFQVEIWFGALVRIPRIAVATSSRVKGRPPWVWQQQPGEIAGGSFEGGRVFSIEVITRIFRGWKVRGQENIIFSNEVVEENDVHTLQVYTWTEYEMTLNIDENPMDSLLTK